jgi:hypothetical protein
MAGVESVSRGVGNSGKHEAMFVETKRYLGVLALATLAVCAAQAAQVRATVAGQLPLPQQGSSGLRLLYEAIMLATLFRRRARDVQSDWYAQAHALRRAGYHSAAVCVMRAAIERQLIRLAMLSDDWSQCTRENKRSIDRLTYWLVGRGLLDESSKRQFRRFAAKASRAAHGKVVGSDESLLLLREARRLRHVINGALQGVMAL